ncbi:MAG: peptidase domain-containing ABC transporter [Chryseobacterium sp.]|nr:MAG: peptidase domain-containing ABC transporter [Chryseobacterium sp.]
MRKFPIYIQPDQMDCGPTCVRMIAKYYGKNISLQVLRKAAGINREGVSLLGISQASEKIGFRTNGIGTNLTGLRTLQTPCILHWNQNHFVVLFRIRNGVYYLADPAKGLIKMSEEEFSKGWISKGSGENGIGIVLSLETSPVFFQLESDGEDSLGFSFMLSYLVGFRQLFIQLMIGLTVGTLLELILPFLTQSIVDTGINTKNINFIYIILIAQGMLLIGRLSVEFIRSWILLHMSTRINISILTDFIIKLMKLPMEFFDTKMTGDILQRMADQSRIQSFLTGSTLNTIFSMFNLVVFTFVLAHYNLQIFYIFLSGSAIYTLWTVAFLKKRRTLDFKRFDISSKNQSAVVQLISGIQEIKLNNSEQQKRWEWEKIQARLFKYNVRSLSLVQIQQAGTFFINEGKNIFITLVVAKSVIDGDLTLGAMMAVQYIIGQLNSPIEQLIVFLQQFQDAKISMERLNEIHRMQDEEPVSKPVITELPNDNSISFRNVTFAYPGAGASPILSNISFTIPKGKTTAIVGMSGSGKTTLLKLLLRFYEVKHGDILVGSDNIDNISFKKWREECGTVMQDGFIFSDTIAKNIVVGDEFPDQTKLEHALDVANIKEFVQSLPLGLATRIGAEGNGISQGQRQRLLIARAVYKNPQYLFFDEATNALDANNEKVIMKNLDSFFQGRTVVVVAHRLSTVRNADQIILLDHGAIAEQGTHDELSESKGSYYNLVRNQLELDA